MSFNFTGIALGKNLEDNISEIEEILGFKLIFIEETDFEEAMMEYMSSNTCYLYYGVNGVLIFTPEPFTIVNQDKKSEQLMITTFSASETVMMFMISASKNGSEYRELMEYNLEKMEDRGAKFEAETEADDGFSILVKAISQTIGENFWNIPQDATTMKYKTQIFSV
jgi:hypothetical protein